MPRLPSDAFERFLALGPARSYSQLARSLGVSKRSVVARASREGWQARIAAIEDKARRDHDAKASEDVAAIDEKHVRMARAIQARALESLRNSPLGNGATAVRALDIAIRIEREILGRASADAKVGPGLAELLEAATKVPPKRVAEVRRQLAETVHGPTAAPAGQPAPETVLSLPAALAPCHVGEN